MTEPAPTLPRPLLERPARILAHRGASGLAPENTLAAFRRAAELGADGVEFDVSLLGDGTAVVFHDATLDRCTDARGPLSGIGAADLARIDAGGWFDPRFRGERIPLMAEVLDLVGETGMLANLEIKPQGDPVGPVAAAVAQALAIRPWTRGRVVVSSFSRSALEALRARMPDQPLAMLWEAPPPDWPAVLAALGAEALHIDHQELTPALLAQAEAEGVALRVYTINDPARLAPLRRPALSGVISDRPDLFLKDRGWRTWAGRG